MKAHITVRHIEECFGPLWFSFDEAWKNMFSACDETEERVNREQAEKRIRLLCTLGLLERNDEGEWPEYRLTARAGTFRHQNGITAPEKRQEPLPGTRGDRLRAYGAALERVNGKGSSASEADKAIVTDPRRVDEWKKYRHFMKHMR